MASAPLSPVSTSHLHEEVYSELTSALMGGRLDPGQRLTLRALASMLGTSVIPVRAAVGRLIAEGAFAQSRSGTVHVPLLKRADFQDLMELRALLESRATRLATGRITAETLAGLRRVAMDLRTAQEHQDIEAYLEANKRLKFGIYDHCGSAPLRSFIHSLWLRVGPYLRLLAPGLAGITQINFHEPALDAIERGDAEAAAQAIARDILEGMQFLLRAPSWDEWQARDLS